MSDHEISVSIEDLDSYQDSLGWAFALGFTQGVLVDDAESARPCGGCDCGLTDADVETRPVSIPASGEFQMSVRGYLEQHNLVDEDDLVAKVEVCPNEVVAHVRE